MSDIIEPALPAAPPTVGNFLSIIAQAARDPNTDVAKMHGLLDVQERMMARQAEIDFNADFAALQAVIPRITKDSQIKHGNNVIAAYASYETIDHHVRPLLIEHGFSLRFNSKQGQGHVVVYATLSHRGGHSITDEIPLGIDTSGAKNNVQGVASTITYGKRILTGMLLNLVFEGEDNDGNTANYVQIDPKYAEELKEDLRNKGALGKHVKQLLQYLGAESIDALDAKDYQKAKTAIAGLTVTP